jgi:hypothetical protein
MEEEKPTKEHSEYAKLWLNAANILAKDPMAKVACPECKIGTLNVKDEPFGVDQIDRYLYCDSCKHHNVLTMTKPV